MLHNTGTIPAGQHLNILSAPNKGSGKIYHVVTAQCINFIILTKLHLILNVFV